MSNITYRLVKGQELTFTEIDENFSSLDSDIRGNRRYFDSQLEQFGLGRDSDFLAILAQRDSDAAAIILQGIANHDSDIADLNARSDSEHAWNIAEHAAGNAVVNDRIDSEHAWNVTEHGVLSDRLDSEHAWNIAEHGVLSDRLDSEHAWNIAENNDILSKIDSDISSLSNTVNGNVLTAGAGISISPANAIANTAPDQIVALTGQDATFVSGTYPNFTISSTDTTYSAGSGMSLSGTQFINSAPDQTVSLTGAGSTTVTGTYPNFTVTSVGTTYTAGNGLTLTGTEFTLSGSYTGTFTATGDVVAYSDMALKSEITAIDEALDKLMSITGYTYNTKGSERRHSGVMAQDVEEVLPEVVHTSEDGTKGVAYGNMMGLVIEAIRELKTQVDELKGR